MVLTGRSNGVDPSPDGAERLTDEVAAAAAAKATADAEKAAAEAAKARADAQATILKDAVAAVPEGPYTGAVQLKEGAGKMECGLLAASALAGAAEKLATTVHAISPSSPVAVFPAASPPTFDELVLFNVQKEVVMKRLGDALGAADNLLAPERLGVAGEEIAAAVGVAGGAIDAVTKLLGFLRTDFSVAGVTVSMPERQLLFAVAGAIHGMRMAVTLPSVYRGGAPAPTGSGGGSGGSGGSAREGVIHDLLALADRRAEALAKARQLAGGSLPAEQRTPVAKQLRDAAALADALMAACGGSARTAKEPFVTRVLREEVVRRTLGEGSLVLLVELDMTGGASYARKNFFSGLFGGKRIPLKFMGGVVVSYALLDGAQGRVLSAGTIPVHGGLVAADDLARSITSGG